jgi:mRNA-degrading endonuclease toxin of MazEF toxin-antitoxin module
MMRYRTGDVVLIRFTFTDESRAKVRPGVVLSGDEYNQGRNEMICAAITSNVSRILPGDILVQRWQAAGLLFPSVVTGIVRTVRRSMLARKLGAMDRTDLDAYRNQLRKVLGL